ncbi:MAG: galactokinase [Clostridiales bacterium]|nr:galactokinase [Clostridiales bacterium]
MKVSEYKEYLDQGVYDEKLKSLYGDTAVQSQKDRLKAAVENFRKKFPEYADAPIEVFSAPGRTEIGGNHTDHQHGCVLAAAVHLDALGVVHFHEEPVIRLHSEGYPMETVSLADLSVRDVEMETSAALIRGIAAGLVGRGYRVGGFDAYVTSDVPGGSGLSSSAAFEILIGTILNEGYNDNAVSAVDLAKIGQYAENVYYGKKSGLMDQAASSVGGLVFMDFADTENPKITAHEPCFEKFGCAICVTDTKGSHSDLTDDYTQITNEMRAVAKLFGCEFLRGVNEGTFYSRLEWIRKSCSDRAILRAMHFFDENRRAEQESEALAERNMERFLELVRASGDSSANLLQNLYSTKNPTQQNIPLALAVSRHVLHGDYAVRVHGGGFAGTIQAFVPMKQVEYYVREMERLFGEGACCVLRIRGVGGVKLS